MSHELDRIIKHLNYPLTDDPDQVEAERFLRALKADLTACRAALAMAEKYLVERGIETKGTVGRTEVLPAIRAALAQAQARLYWTTEQPTQVGWYWMRRVDIKGTPYGVCQVRNNGQGSEVFLTDHWEWLPLEDATCEWAGPLPEAAVPPAQAGRGRDEMAE